VSADCARAGALPDASHPRTRKSSKAALQRARLYIVNDSWFVVCWQSGLRGPQETVKHVVIVPLVSRDRARVVDAVGERALAGTCARARGVERGDGWRATWERLCTFMRTASRSKSNSRRWTETQLRWLQSKSPRCVRSANGKSRTRESYRRSNLFTAAAKKLGISRCTLQRKINEMNIARARTTGAS
jgi:hypothetical protein